MAKVAHTGSTKKKVGKIDILTHLYQYVKFRGGHYGAFGGSRSTVVFLNNNLSVLYPCCQEKILILRTARSSQLSSNIEGSQAHAPMALTFFLHIF